MAESQASTSAPQIVFKDVGITSAAVTSLFGVSIITSILFHRSRVVTPSVIPLPLSSMQLRRLEVLLPKLEPDYRVYIKLTESDGEMTKEGKQASDIKTKNSKTSSKVITFYSSKTVLLLDADNFHVLFRLVVGIIERPTAIQIKMSMMKNLPIEVRRRY